MHDDMRGRKFPGPHPRALLILCVTGLLSAGLAVAQEPDILNPDNRAPDCIAT
jgi:hypothetical protein